MYAQYMSDWIRNLCSQLSFHIVFFMDNSFSTFNRMFFRKEEGGMYARARVYVIKIKLLRK